MNYTRKRALLACDFCRHRKRKCDGARPRCSTCEESNADCVYKELPADRVESCSPSAVVERLTRIETLLEEQSQRLDDLVRGGGQEGFGLFSPPGTRSSILPLEVSHSPQFAGASPASAPNRSQENLLDRHLEQATFLIPYDHSTSANSLLAWPRVKALIGDYPEDYFFKLEQSLPLPPGLDLPNDNPEGSQLPAINPSNPNVLESLTRNYFSVVHPNFPLFTYQEFRQWQAYLYEHGPEDTPETAICLCVYALGCLVSPREGHVDASVQAENDDLALQFFQPALTIILRHTVWGFRPRMEICQALILASSYFAHLGRPLHSWKMAVYASEKFISLHDRLKRAGFNTDQNDNYMRVFWSCFMIECDRAAELDVPRSGIEPQADKMPLPRTMNVTENDNIIYFVAETAIRRLLNRIHCSLYAKEHTDINALAGDPAMLTNISLSKLLSLSAELNRQLEEWYHSIPGKIRPPIGTEPVANDRGKVLRIRYYAARHIIHRPFVLYVVLQQPTTPTGHPTPVGSPQPLVPLPRVVREKCQVCIDSCQTYLYNVVEMLDKRSPYLWTFSQSCMACLLVLLLSKSSPLLSSITPELQPLTAMVLPRLRRWATPGSSFEAEVKILESLTRSLSGGA
ncbi:hypothetical protein GE09DRAFT_371046 [Coniochaeta sp. 2T2.1]|nr:hypothetical protein GE09DRAFT_371046 [Coniochaeta sp. 2T2.1]